MIKVPWDAAAVILWVTLPAVAIFFLWLFLSIFRVSAKEARQFLTQKDYTNDSTLVKDAQGSWAGVRPRTARPYRLPSIRISRSATK